jgi:hypothetical protein
VRIIGKMRSQSVNNVHSLHGKRILQRVPERKYMLAMDAHHLCHMEFRLRSLFVYLHLTAFKNDRRPEFMAGVPDIMSIESGTMCRN